MVSEAIDLLHSYLPPLIPAFFMLLFGYFYIRRIESKFDGGLEEITGTVEGITAKGKEYAEEFRKELPENMNQLFGALIEQYGPKMTAQITEGMESLFKRTIGQMGGIAKGLTGEVIEGIPGGKLAKKLGKQFGIEPGDVIELYQTYKQLSGQVQGGGEKKPNSGGGLGALR